MDKTSGFGYGLEVITGVEYFISKNKSLYIEYGLEIRYQNLNVSQQKIDSSTPIYIINSSSKSLRLNGSYVRLRLSIYF